VPNIVFGEGLDKDELGEKEAMKLAKENQDEVVDVQDANAQQSRLHKEGYQEVQN
jgi:hypothetical protein